MKTQSVVLSLQNHLFSLKAERPGLLKNDLEWEELGARGWECYRADCSYIV